MRRGVRLRPGRLVAVAVLAASLSIGSAAPAAAVVLYTVVVTPLSANQYSATDFSVTASNLNLLDDLGCLQLDLPVSFNIVSLSQPDASNGEDWLISRSGQSVVVQSDGGGGRLELGDSVSFTVRAKPQQAGIFAWEHHAHRDQDCDGGDLLGAPVTVTVLPAVLPTPTLAPLPTILPTPTLAPLPTILPTPTLAPLPSILPTPKPTPRPTQAPSPTPGGAASQPPGPTTGDASPSDPPTSGGAAPRAPGATGAGADPPAEPDLDREPEAAAGPIPAGGGSTGGLDLRRPRDMRLPAPTDSGGGLGLSPFSLLVDMGAWYVPAAVIGGPGLLVIGFVALQMAGAAAWMPAVRRLRGEKPAAR